MTDKLACGHPKDALEYGGASKGDPVRCGWCRELAEVRQEADARAARVVRLFAEIAHEHPGIDWGVDASGIHVYSAGEPMGCPVCEALDEVLGDARATYDVLLTPDQRQAIREFKDTGLLWLVNTSVMHPRGYAIAVTVAEDGEPIAMSVVGDGTEPWCFDGEAVDQFYAHNQAEHDREFRWAESLRGRTEPLE